MTLTNEKETRKPVLKDFEGDNMDKTAAILEKTKVGIKGKS